MKKNEKKSKNFDTTNILVPVILPIFAEVGSSILIESFIGPKMKVVNVMHGSVNIWHKSNGSTSKFYSKCSCFKKLIKLLFFALLPTNKYV